MRGQVKVYQKKLVQKRRRRIFYVSFYSLVLFGFLYTGLSYISRLDSLTLHEVVVRGNTRLESAIVDRIVREGIEGNYGAFFSKANAFLYPRKDIENTLRALPLVKEVDVSRSGFNTIAVQLVERTEAAVWCNKEKAVSETCFSLDENGLVFAPIVSNLASSSLFVYRGVLDDAEPGKQLLPALDFKKIQFFIHDIKNLSVDPLSATLSSTTNYMTIELRAGGKIIVNAGDDLSVTLQNIAAVLQDRSVAPSFSDFLTHLEYIKFDAGNKVVYKLKNVSVEAP